jgi:hypothetical protein
VLFPSSAKRTGNAALKGGETYYQSFKATLSLPFYGDRCVSFWIPSGLFLHRLLPHHHSRNSPSLSLLVDLIGAKYDICLLLDFFVKLNNK